MTDFPPQKIIKLKASNFMKLTAVEITPEPGQNVITLGGRNGAGKSAVLNAITAVFEGAKAFAEEPIHEGTERAEIVIETDDLVITRVITPKGNSLVVKNRKDAKIKYSSPQEVLDAFYGAIGFDPAAFQRMKAGAQLEMLQQVLGLDFDKIEATRKEKYDLRTSTGRDLDTAKGALTSTVFHKEVKAPVVIADLLEEQKTARKANEQHGKMQGAVTAAKNELNNLELRCTELEAELAKTKKLAETQRQNVEVVTETATMFPAVDEAGINAKLASAESINAKHRSNVAHAGYTAEVARLTKLYDEYTASIQFIDAKKIEAISNAKLPVRGLSFNEKGVIFNGKPFSQASTAEQIRVSVAMGMSLNPKLKVVLIRDASLLDGDSYAIIEAMASEHGYQVWMEVVTRDAEEEEGCTVVIEAGEAK